MRENNLNSFEHFLFSEYSNIAQAHFKSIETVTTFFRYYLLIASVPISFVGILFQTRFNGFFSAIDLYRLPTGILFIIISIIGILVSCYVINLRLDAILYARVVNGIRKYFYDNFDESIILKNWLRVLPQSPQLPPYLEGGLFFPVVAVFGIINSCYLFVGVYILERINFRFIILFLILGVFLHFCIYWGYSWNREYRYLKSNIIGVDIDGVLNRHREHFCTLLKNNTGKSILPEDIIIIPVHENPHFNITRDEERLVFNHLEYWINMPPMDKAADRIANLRNVFRLKVYIFTYRPWPDAKLKDEKREYKKRFLESYYNYKPQNQLMKFICHFKDPIEEITKEWLNKNKFYYDKLIFEKGNDYTPGPRNEFKNRFNLARRYKIRFFVEDDLEKAIKLSFICDTVFLMSHPYNECNPILSAEENDFRKNIPSNIIRVKDWDEIYKWIRRIL